MVDFIDEPGQCVSQCIQLEDGHIIVVVIIDTQRSGSLKQHPGVAVAAYPKAKIVKGQLLLSGVIRYLPERSAGAGTCLIGFSQIKVCVKIDNADIGLLFRIQVMNKPLVASPGDFMTTSQSYR